MKRKQWLAGILAVGLLCALPLSGALAAPRARTRAVVGLASVSPTMTLTVSPAGTVDPVYGSELTLRAVYTPASGEAAPAADAVVTFSCGPDAQSVSLGTANLVAVSPTDGTYEASLTYTTAGKEALKIGTNTLTASYTPAAGSVVTGKAAVTLKKKPLTAAPKGTVIYNGTTSFKNVELHLVGVESGDGVRAEADLTVNDKNVGTPQVTAAAAGAAKNSAAKGAEAAAIPLSGAKADFYTLPVNAVTGTLKIQKAKLSFTAGAEDKVYDGGNTATAKDVTFAGLQNGETLVEDTDYTVSAEFTGGDYNAADAEKDVKVTVALKDSETVKNYELPTSTFDTKAKIAPAPLTVGSVTIQEKTYDGNEAATVTAIQFTGLAQGDGQPALGTDYTAAAVFENANAGEDKAVSVTLTAKPGSTLLANYTLPSGTVAAKGKIAPKALAPGMVTDWGLAASYTYDGAEKKPVPTVADGSLLTRSDYELAYENNTNAGTAKVTVRATAGGNYTGELSQTFTIQQADPGLTATVTRKGTGSAAKLKVRVTTQKAGSALAAEGRISVTVKAAQGEHTAQGSLENGAFEVELNDLPGAGKVTLDASYTSSTNNYKGASLQKQVTLAPAPTPKPAPEPAPTPAPTPKPFDWYPALGSIQSVSSGKVTIDAGGEIAVPHFIWQAFYGKDITLTITRGADKYVFNGKDLKASGFDPDNGHNLTDLSAYIGRSYDKPKPTATPAPTATPKPTASPTAKPTATPAPTLAPAATPAPSAQPAQGGGPAGWLYWVIGGAALLLAALVAALLVMRRKSAGQDPYGYNE